jgi:hypothetical protein
VSKNTNRTSHSVLGASQTIKIKTSNLRCWGIFFSYPKNRTVRTAISCFQSKVPVRVEQFFLGTKQKLFCVTFCFQSFTQWVIWTTMRFLLRCFSLFVLRFFLMLCWNKEKEILGQSSYFFNICTTKRFYLLDSPVFRVPKNLGNRFCDCDFEMLFHHSCLLNILDFCSFLHISELLFTNCYGDNFSYGNKPFQQ